MSTGDEAGGLNPQFALSDTKVSMLCKHAWFPLKMKMYQIFVRARLLPIGGPKGKLDAARCNLKRAPWDQLTESYEGAHAHQNSSKCQIYTAKIRADLCF